ncbi:biotin-dependent carboxyltransferase family protein [Pseudomonas sivasensis]|uniref:5-oxoprolinase subunit C family protein n=1 Tax=Pseudomonas sivasensis TaxID=1880678 RepID=UPI0021AA200D|nr:biotin-dependent carboxyltransferase family protein [Pseudomonas sivasensis]MCT4496885.1 biotin-dependent carboxyltransferase family protein [Pseudomonas sivasensis]
MTIKVIKPGMLSTFQDTGRHGFQHWGVPVTGVMDEDAHALCNLLVGNPRTFSTLEMTLQGPTLHFQAKAVIALAGADLGAELDAIPLKPGVAALVSPGSTLSFGKRRQGARSYLAVGGGFLLPPLMNSTSTYSRGGFGGLRGRALQAGDLIPICSSFANPPRLSPRSHFGLYEAVACEQIRVIAGREWKDFSAESQAHFLNHDYTLSGDSDRMGYRLDGTPLALSSPKELLSESVTFGTVQVPPSGKPLILMADRQTTGGYPRIAQVASVDLPRLAQLLPGDKLRFSLIDLSAAETLLLTRARTLKAMEAFNA